MIFQILVKLAAPLVIKKLLNNRFAHGIVIKGVLPRLTGTGLHIPVLSVALFTIILIAALVRLHHRLISTREQIMLRKNILGSHVGKPAVSLFLHTLPMLLTYRIFK